MILTKGYEDNGDSLAISGSLLEKNVRKTRLENQFKNYT